MLSLTIMINLEYSLDHTEPLNMIYSCYVHDEINESGGKKKGKVLDGQAL